MYVVCSAKEIQRNTYIDTFGKEVGSETVMEFDPKDAIEAVGCDECRWCDDSRGIDGMFCHFLQRDVTADDFCAWGRYE